ncbi:HigA family addiction module antitoxin [Leptolyngbya sp. NIES-2104]|uniref:HigA family addiction module antitoxin n=1 Tax=Leptolyngbya sp. NIES-2104 TaxID=1552121 RepID=UPI0006EC7883|nr:HigA family addiction module antitoxin [Leptolyngbya sp. NIES-2104]GAP98729.1 HigA protein [Leptolyngbya sp. NIES-2104]
MNDRKARPVQPGEVILDLLDELEMSQSQFAEVLGLSQETVDEIIRGEEPITVDAAIRIGRAFGNGHRLWLNLQQKVDVWDAIQSHHTEYDRVPTLIGE